MTWFLPTPFQFAPRCDSYPSNFWTMFGHHSMGRQWCTQNFSMEGVRGCPPPHWGRGLGRFLVFLVENTVFWFLTHSVWLNTNQKNFPRQCGWGGGSNPLNPLWYATVGRITLLKREITFRLSQCMWSQYTNVTDARSDMQTTCHSNTAINYSNFGARLHRFKDIGLGPSAT